jgi:hypothetical protein
MGKRDEPAQQADFVKALCEEIDPASTKLALGAPVGPRLAAQVRLYEQNRTIRD